MNQTLFKEAYFLYNINIICCQISKLKNDQKSRTQRRGIVNTSYIRVCPLFFSCCVQVTWSYLSLAR